MPPSTNSSNGKKSRASLASDHLHIRVVPAEKSVWYKVARRLKKQPAAWIKDTLNDACEKLKATA